MSLQLGFSAKGVAAVGLILLAGFSFGRVLHGVVHDSLEPVDGLLSMVAMLICFWLGTAFRSAKA